MSMLVGATLLASTLLGAAPAQSADVPAEFGTDWHDPVTAAPPVEKPSGKSCRVTLAEARFRDFTPYKGTYSPPEGCGDRWGKVVLRLDGKVKGRQFDRLGYLHVGGVEILRTSTPSPRPTASGGPSRRTSRATATRSAAARTSRCSSGTSSTTRTRA